ncbi:MAG: hypothetical protein ACPG7F_00865 [Aggregatilineales bacterium]
MQNDKHVTHEYNPDTGKIEASELQWQLSTHNLPTVISEHQRRIMFVQARRYYEARKDILAECNRDSAEALRNRNFLKLAAIREDSETALADLLADYTERFFKRGCVDCTTALSVRAKRKIEAGT